MKTRIVILVLLTFASGISAQQSWALKDCIRYAIENNLSIRKQEVTRLQQEVELNTAKLSRLPNLNGSTSQTFNFGRGLNDENTYTDRNTRNTMFGLNTDVPLFTGFQIPNNIALNKLNLKAATEDLRKAKEDISIEVTSSFLQVLFNEEIYKVAQGQVSLSKEQAIRIEQLGEVGKASVAEICEARARLAQDEMSAVQANNNWRLSVLDLTQLLELSSPDLFIAVAPKEDVCLKGLPTPEEIFNRAVVAKPVILAAQYRLEGTQKNIRIAQSGYYPQLSFGAGLNAEYYHIEGIENKPFGSQLNNNFSKYIGFTLKVPLFNRMETRNRIKTARLQYFTQSIQLEETKKELYKEIQQAYYSALAARTKYTSSRTAVQANEAAFKLMSEKYVEGKASFVEYNEVKQNLMKATSEGIQAKYDYLFRIKILDFYWGVELDI